MILEKDYEVLMEAATIEDRTQFAKAYAPDDDLALVHARSGVEMLPPSSNSSSDTIVSCSGSPGM